MVTAAAETTLHAQRNAAALEQSGTRCVTVSPRSAAQVANLFSSARVVPARGHSLFSSALDDVLAADTGSSRPNPCNP